MSSDIEIKMEDGSVLMIKAFDYGSRFINDQGRILWLSLDAESKTAAFAARVLTDEAHDRSTDEEINAILFEHDIDPSAIADLRADVIACAKRARRNAYYHEKCRREPWYF